MSAQHQIIDDEKRFAHDLDKFVKSSGLHGFDYALVAVFGSQSTGKSTLLNSLFGSHFDTMNEAERKQTTKGIWMAKASDANILVMDVEGTDGRERGEDQDFERKAALFSLATSQVLIVNLWEHQVGLYQGANMGLLKTVFEVNLQLFAKTQSKSLLLFVIRDHVGTTPLNNLATTLTTDLERIWQSITKPEGFENCKISDYFDLQFEGLAHRVLMPKQFDDSVASLHRKFQSSIFLKPEYHRGIPIDGFSRYTEGIWDQIVTNKDLDLPTQQELLAQYRCDEIARAAEEDFDAVIRPVEARIGSGKVLDLLGNTMIRARTAALRSFDEEASRYHKLVYSVKRKEFVAKLDARLHALFVAQLAALHKASVLHFEEKVTNGVKSQSYDFAMLVAGARKEAEDGYLVGTRECLVEEAGWNFDEDFRRLQTDLASSAKTLRAAEMARVVKRIERKIKTNLDAPLSMVFKKTSPDLWDRVLEEFDQVLNDAVHSFSEKSESFNSSAEETAKGLLLLKQRAWKTLCSKVDEEVMDANMLMRLREEFEDKFRYDESGMPRIWKPHDDIDGVYRSAREYTLNLLPIFAKIQRSDGTSPDISGLESSVVDEEEFEPQAMLAVLSPNRQHDLASRFRKSADAIYVDAKRSTISSVARVPLYFYALLVALGWNEIMAVLRNPVYFMFLLISLTLAYVVHQLNLWTPILQLGDGMTRQAIDLGKERLREILQVPAGPVPVANEMRVPPQEIELGELDASEKM